LLIISLVYALYSLKHQPYDYFKKKRAVSEYELVKKILYIEVPVFITLTSIVLGLTISGLVPTISSTNTANDVLTFYIVRIVVYALQYSVTAAALWMIFHILRKEFRYYYARAVIKNMPDGADNVERLYRLNKALNSYNKYLLRSQKSIPE